MYMTDALVTLKLVVPGLQVVIWLVLKASQLQGPRLDPVLHLVPSLFGFLLSFQFPFTTPKTCTASLTSSRCKSCEYLNVSVCYSGSRGNLSLLIHILACF